MASKKTIRVFDKEKLSVRASEINMLKGKRNYNLVTKIIMKLKDALLEDKGLIALAAPQIGYPYRIFCIKFDNDEIRGFINPLIYKYSDETHMSRETQLGHNSDKEYIVPRISEIEMSFQTPVGTLEANSFSGAVAEVIQQLDDLLNGVMLEDYGLEVLDGFDDASPEDKEEIIKMYLEHLSKTNNALSDEIEKDKDNAKLNEAILFMEQAKLGNVEVKFEENKNYRKNEGSKPKSVQEIIKDIEALKE